MDQINKLKNYLSYKSREFRYNFLNDSILKQSLRILKYALLTVIIFVALLFYVNDKSVVYDFSFAFIALKVLFYIDTFDNLTVEGFELGSVAINHNINLVHTFILVLLVVVWQAVLIFKMMQTDESIVVSKDITYYPMKNTESEGIQPSSVAFRLMNDGFNTVYNVNITAFLKIKPANGPYRHYKLTVRDPFISSLEVGMPYQMFINTGVVSNVEFKAVFIDSGKPAYTPETKYIEDKNCSEAKKIPHPLYNKSDRPIPDEAWIVVLIEAFDDFLDQTNITKKVYDYHNLKNEEFTSIESKLEAARRIESYKKIKKDKSEQFKKDKFKKKTDSANWYYDDEDGKEIIVEDVLTDIKQEIKDLDNADKPYNIFDKNEIDKYFNSFGKVNRFDDLGDK